MRVAEEGAPLLPPRSELLTTTVSLAVFDPLPKTGTAVVVMAGWNGTTSKNSPMAPAGTVEARGSWGR